MPAIWEEGYWSNGFVEAAEGAWATFKETAPAIVDAVKEAVGVETEEQLQNLGPVQQEAALSEAQKQQIVLTEIFRVIYHSPCYLSLDEYNARVAEVSGDLASLPYGVFPEWWGQMTNEQYNARREEIGCPRPEYEWQGPIQTEVTPSMEEVEPAAPPPAVYPPAPQPQQAVPTKKPMGGTTLLLLGGGIALGGYMLYKLVFPPKKGRRKKKKALMFF